MKKFIALLLCGLLLCGCAPSVAVTEPATEPPTEMTTEMTTEEPTETITEAPTEAPTDPPLVSVTIYHGHENADGFETAEFEVAEVTAEILVEKLIEAGALNEGVILNSMEADGGQLTLDFKSAFADQLNTMGTSGERMMMGSVVNTFLTAFDAASVSVRVDGQILESGHVVYDEPMGFIE